VKVHRVKPGDPNAGKIEELAQQPAEPVALPDDEAGQKPLIVVGPGRAGKLFDGAADRGQRIPDFVGQGSGESGDRFEPLRPDTADLPRILASPYMTIFAAAGFAGGFVYWLLAGQSAGRRPAPYRADADRILSAKTENRPAKE
jgi:hypothetical protein